MIHLVIGAMGSIGSRYQRLLEERGDEVRICDINHPADWNNIDMVWICTPPMVHHEDIFQALNCGVYAFCEKPLTNDPKIMEEMVTAYNDKKGKVYVSRNMRFHPCVKILKEELDKGTIGEPIYMRFAFSHCLSNMKKEWHNSYIMFTGIILDCIHYIDLAVWFAGQQEHLQGFSSALEYPIFDYARLYITHKKKVLSEIALDFIRRNKFINVEIVGKNGTLTWYSQGKNPEKAMVMLNDEKPLLFEGEINLDDMYREQINYVIDNKPDNFMEHINVLKLAMEATYAQQQR